MRIFGKTVGEYDSMKEGSHQAMEIFPPKKITLVKFRFDQIHLDRLYDASSPDTTAKLAVMTMEDGIANLFIISRQTSILKAKIDKKIPKNKSVFNQTGKARDKFFEQCLQAILAKLNLDIVGNLIIGSPGFVKDNFMEYLKTSANKASNHKLQSFLSQIILVRCSSGFKNSVQEILEDQTVKHLLKESILGMEQSIMEEFMNIAGNETDMACYGVKAV